MTGTPSSPAPALDARPTLRVRGVNHYFGQGEIRTQVLFDNTLEVMPGELVILSGPSGSGKTTLLTLIGGLRTLQEGEIDIWDRERGGYVSLHGLDEAELVHVRRSIGFIFQRHNLFESLTAMQNVRMAQQLRPLPSDPDAPARDLLTRLLLAERLHYKPHRLSGGQRQRVAVARALINRPGLVLADEPTAALDEKSGEIVFNLLRDLAREQGSTSLIVTHDSRIMNRADRVVEMDRGAITTNLVIAERMFVYDGLRRCAAFAPLLPTLQFQIADSVLIGLHPDLPTQPHHRERCPHVAAFPAGTAIVRQGERGDCFYLVRRGRVAVLVDDGTGPRQVNVLGKGDFFGDRALVTDEPRNATVVALEDVETYTIGRTTFQAARETSQPFIRRVLDVYARGDGASAAP